ncbi:hypothetical protein Nepgr_025966 [Nepenthes gracilis]|uniref:Uncharacterized protein n=1 Tax=Nepenthes gracilis TaxID=150966 RepID=A0AAD3T5Z7_NEPGR|nr:hypothetical protein Nepgr_025966 [Nepenthes gracilis]
MPVEFVIGIMEYVSSVAKKIIMQRNALNLRGEGTLQICNSMAYALIDPATTYSFVIPSFQELKKRLTSTLVLSMPDRSGEFVVYCDASQRGKIKENQMNDPYLMEIAGDLSNEARADFNTRTDGVLHFRNSIYVLNIEELKEEILNEAHRSRLLDPDIIQDLLERIKIIRDRLMATQSRQKSYVNRTRFDLKFEVGDRVFLKVSLRKEISQFRVRGRLKPTIWGVRASKRGSLQIDVASVFAIMS